MPPKQKTYPHLTGDGGIFICIYIYTLLFIISTWSDSMTTVPS